MKRKDMIEDLQTLKAFFEEQSGAYPMSLEYAIKELSAQPERKKGKWKYIGFMTVECTECHAQLHELECTNYCPNCGADMRGEEDG